MKSEEMGYLEIDCNVFSSQIAMYLVSLIDSASESLVIDLAFTIEGRAEDELPEAILGAVSLRYIHLPKCKPIEPGDYGVTWQRSMPEGARGGGKAF